MRPKLSSVTLIVVDCVDYERAKLALEHCAACCEFNSLKLLTHFDAKDPYVVKVPKISSIEEYSRFMIKDLTN